MANFAQFFKMVYLTRKEHFNAAHRLSNPAWSEEENLRVFGKCANKNWHGHNYDLYVTVKGEPDPQMGWLMDAKVLGEIIEREVTIHLDHRNLNLDVDFLKNTLPSIENLVKVIWQRLEPHIQTSCLHCVKLVETETIYAEYYGE